MDSVALTLVLLLLTAFVTVYVAVVVHEFGHAVAALAVGFPVTSVGIGRTRPLFVVPIRGTRVYCCLQRPDVGFTFVEYPSFTLSRRKLLLFQAAGILANLVLTAGGVLGCIHLPGCLYWGVFAVINAFAALESAVPLAAAAGSIDTDGRQLLQTWRGTAASSLPLLRVTRGLRPLWQAVGDRRVEARSLVAAAELWHDLGDADHARTLVREARSVQPCLPVLADVTARLLDAASHEAADEFTEAEAIYKDLADARRAANDVIGSGTVTCRQPALAALAARRGDAPAADSLMPPPEQCSFLAGFPDLAMTLLLGAFRLPRSEPNDARIIALRALLDTGRLSPEVAWQYHRLLAEHFTAELDWEQAEAAEVLAWPAALAVHALLDPEDQARFEQCLQPFQESTQRLLHGRGKVAEGDAIADFFTERRRETRQAAEERQKAVAELASTESEGRRMRIALVLMAMNALVIAVGMLVVWLVAIEHTGWWLWAAVTIFTQAPFLAGSLFYWLLYGAKRLMNGGNHGTTPPGIPRESPGTMMLVLTTMPWIVGALLGAVGLLIWTGW